MDDRADISAAPPNSTSAPPKIWRVSELNRRIRDSLEGTFGDIWLEGEISNFRAQPSGHWYFTLKDETAQMDAVFFAGARRRGENLQWTGDAAPRDGLRVQVLGRVTVYEPRGRLQINVLRLKECGIGELQIRFEQLKRRLAAEGLFDPARKRTLPLLPQRVAIVTSPSGAALQDLLKIAGRRFPNLHLTIFGVRVQGKGAAEEIAAAIDEANRRHRQGAARFDALIVGRGGGSLEDLWAFNEEIVARAIAKSAIPIISAVGHETDFTICDFAADVRAPTPSAAAELLVGRKDEFEERLRRIGHHLRLQMDRGRLQCRNRMGDLRSRLVRHRPEERIRALWRERRVLGRDLRRALESAARTAQQRLDETAAALRDSWARRRERWNGTLDRLRAQLAALGPDAVLRRGFSITLLSDGRALRDPSEAPPGARLRTRLLAGEVSSVVIGAEATSRRRAEKDRTGFVQFELFETGSDPT